MPDLSLLLPDVDPEQARRFLRTWFGDRDGWVVLTRIYAGGQHLVQSWAFETEKFIDSFTTEGLASLCSDQGGNWNVYISCSCHREDPTGGERRRRGGKSTIDWVHGVWLDLDVKNESFAAGAAAVDEFIRSLPLNPTMVVDSGSGGRHVYWRLEEPVTREEGEQLCVAWWAFCQETAGDVYIDKVTTSDRIMRLPGTVRWPKKSGEDARQVSLLYDQGGRVTPEMLLDVAGMSWQRHMDSVRSTRGRVQSDWGLARAALSVSGDGSWGDLVTLAGVEELFNSVVDWDDILIPAGWRYVNKDHEGRRHWARPGQDGKSAHTDYPPSPHVMNLFSNAPDTGLSQLQAAGVVLSKMVVYAHLHYKGDMTAMIEAFISAQRASEETGERRG